MIIETVPVCVKIVHNDAQLLIQSKNPMLRLRRELKQES